MKYLLLISLLGCGTPHIEQACTMNGIGHGECSFTNTGTAEGTRCGHIMVTHFAPYKTKDSSLFCSGPVAANSTKTVQFQVPLNGMCFAMGQKWTDICTFEFDAEMPPKP